MLHSIDQQAFAAALRQTYTRMTPESSTDTALSLIKSLDDSLEQAVLAWIQGEAVPDVSDGKYSLEKILAIRGTGDYVEAFQLFSEYRTDHIKGEKSIWRPTRSRRQVKPR